VDSVTKHRITDTAIFKELVEEPRRYYNSYNKKWQISNNQNSSINYSLKVPAEAKEEIKRAIAFMERHTVDRSVFEIQDSIA
jgi:hypothetical protein